MAPRRTCAALVTALAVAASTWLAAAPAHAEWTEVGTSDVEAVGQACVTRLEDGKVRVSVRVDNRHGTERSRVHLFRSTPDWHVRYGTEVRTALVDPGEVSRPVTMVFRSPRAKLWIGPGTREGMSTVWGSQPRRLAAC